MNTNRSEYTRGLIERATPTVRRAYHRMRAEGLSDHVIVVVLAGGELDTSIRPREMFWAELQAVVRGRVELPQSPPVRPPGTCWVVFIDDDAPEGGTRLRLAGFGGDLEVQNAFRGGRLLAPRKGESRAS